MLINHLHLSAQVQAEGLDGLRDHTSEVTLSLLKVLRLQCSLNELEEKVDEEEVEERRRRKEVDEEEVEERRRRNEIEEVETDDGELEWVGASRGWGGRSRM